MKRLDYYDKKYIDEILKMKEDQKRFDEILKNKKCIKRYKIHN